MTLSERKERVAAEEIRTRRERLEKAYSVLPAGTHVKPSISWLRSYWLVVVNDPGPVTNRERKIQIMRCEPNRSDERYWVRRDRVTVKQDTVAVASPPPGVPRASPMPRRESGEKVATK